MSVKEKKEQKEKSETKPFLAIASADSTPESASPLHPL